MTTVLNILLQKVFFFCFLKDEIQKIEAPPLKKSKKPDFQQLGDILKSRKLDSKSPIENVSGNTSADDSFIDVSDQVKDAFFLAENFWEIEILQIGSE